MVYDPLFEQKLTEVIQGRRPSPYQAAQQSGPSSEYQYGEMGGKLGGAYGISQLGGGSTAATPVGSTALADGTAGILMSDGSVVAANSGTSALAGVAPYAAGAVGLGILANNIYERGGKQIASGEGKSKDYANTFLNVNPLTAWVNPVLGALGMESVGTSLFGKPVDELRRSMIQNRFKELGLTQDTPTGAQGIDLGGGQFLNVARGNTEADRLAMSGGEVIPGVFMNEADKAKWQQQLAQGYRNPYEIDWGAEGVGEDVALVAPLARIIAGGAANQEEQIATAYLVNALQQRAAQDSDEEFLRGLFDRANLGREDAFSALRSTYGTSGISDWERQVAEHDMDVLLRGVERVNPGGEGWIDPAHRAMYDDFRKREAARTGQTVLDTYINEEGRPVDFVVGV